MEDLKNIIAYENANIMTNFSNWDREKDVKSKYEFLGKFLLFSVHNSSIEEMLKEVDESERDV